jgi:hypothetical protein
MWLRLKELWLKYESKVILILGFLMVSTVAFEAGFLKGGEVPKNPLVIEKPAESQVLACSSSNVSEAQNLLQEVKNSVSGSIIPDQKCAFIGSKNSNKYHLPTCRWAKSIKAENKVCFSSEDEAKNKGYLPDKNCIK